MSSTPKNHGDSAKFIDLLLQVETDLVDQHMALLWSKVVQSTSSTSSESNNEGAGEDEHIESEECEYLDECICLEDLDARLLELDRKDNKDSKTWQPRDSKAKACFHSPKRLRTLQNMFRLLDPPQDSNVVVLVCNFIAYALRFEIRPQMRELSAKEEQEASEKLLEPWTPLVERLPMHINLTDHLQAFSYASMAYEFQKSTRKPLDPSLIVQLLSLLTPSIASSHEHSKFSFSFALVVLDILCSWAFFTQTRTTKGIEKIDYVDAICKALMLMLDYCLTYDAANYLETPTVTLISAAARSACSTLVAGRGAPPTRVTSERLLSVLSTAFQRFESILNPSKNASKTCMVENMIGEKMEYKPPAIPQVTEEIVLCCMWSLTGLEMLSNTFCQSTYKWIPQSSLTESLAIITGELTRLSSKVLACAFPRSFMPPYRKLISSALNTIDRMCKMGGNDVITVLLDAGLRITFNCIWLIRTLFPNYFRFRGNIAQLDTLMSRIEMRERKPRFEPSFPSSGDWDKLREAISQASFEECLSSIITTDTPLRAVISTLRMLIPSSVWTSQAALFVIGKIFSQPHFESANNSPLPQLSSSSLKSAEKSFESFKSSSGKAHTSPENLSSSATLSGPPSSSSPHPLKMMTHTSHESIFRPTIESASTGAVLLPHRKPSPPSPLLPSAPYPIGKPLWKAKRDLQESHSTSESVSGLSIDAHRKPLVEDPCTSLTLWDLTKPHPADLITTWEEAIHAFCRTGLRPEVVFAVVDELKGTDACQLVNNQAIDKAVERFLKPKLSGKHYEAAMDPDQKEIFWSQRLRSHFRPFFMRMWLLTPSLTVFNMKDYLLQSWRSVARHLVYETASVFRTINSSTMARVRVVPAGLHYGAIFNAFHLDFPHSGDIKALEKAEEIIKSHLPSKTWCHLFLPSDDSFHVQFPLKGPYDLLKLDYGPAFYCYFDLGTAVLMAKLLYPTCPIVTVIPVNWHSQGLPALKNCIYLNKPETNPVPVHQLPFDHWSRAVFCIRNKFRDSFANQVLESSAVLGPMACSWWDPDSHRAMRFYTHLPSSKEDVRHWNAVHRYNFASSLTGKEEAFDSALSLEEDDLVTGAQETGDEMAQKDCFEKDEQILIKNASKGGRSTSEFDINTDPKIRSIRDHVSSDGILDKMKKDLPHLRTCPIKWESDSTIERSSLLDLLRHPRTNDCVYYIAIRHEYMKSLLEEARKRRSNGERAPGPLVMRLKPSGGTYPLPETSSSDSSSSSSSSNSSSRRSCSLI